MKRYILIVLCLSALAACRPEPTGNIDVQPEIFPDYKDVTVPANIAPLNFEVLSEEGSRWYVMVTSAEGTFYGRTGNGLVSFGKRKWRRLLSENKGGELNIRICEKREGKWYSYNPFVVKVAEDEIDPRLVYRLVTPGYSLWKEMIIRQRDLESFDEEVIYSNVQGRGNCVNCHSFCDRDPENFLMHMRSELAGTYIFRNGGKEKLDTKTDSTISSLVYPYWHHSGKYVAFSVNRTNQVLHLKDPNRIEVFDEASDVVIYDLGRHEIVTSDILSDGGSFETFPTFSPDGRSLYFCSSKAVEPMPERYRDVRYSLCRVGFNPEDCSFGEKVDTLYNAETQGGSVSFPRISPDGRYMVFALSGYGNFSIWHKDSDLYCIDLQEDTLYSMDALNSSDVESYHSWSSNGRWLVFSSRRDDGLYTKPYISYIGEDGIAHKPFLLPQKNPKEFYDAHMYAYNIPEFVNGKVKVTGSEIAAFAGTADGMKLDYRKK